MDPNFSASQEQNLRFDDNESHYVKVDSNFFDTNEQDGLIFIQRIDAVSSIVRTITKQQFSSIALVYVSNASGRLRNKVMGWHTSRNGTLQLDDVDGIFKDPLVTRVLFKAFKQQYQPRNNIKFRTSLLRMVTDEIRITTLRNYSNLDVLYQLVGLPNPDGDDRRSMTSIEFVNKVMTHAHASVNSLSGFSNSEYVRLRHDDRFGEDQNQSSSLLASLTHPMNQVKPTSDSDFNKLGQSYILRNDICDDTIYDVACTGTCDAQRAAAIVADKIESRSSLTKFAAAIIDAIQIDPTFYSKVVEGVNMGKMYDAARRDKVNAVLNRTLADHEMIMQLSPSQEIVDRLNDTRRSMADLFESSIPELRSK